MEILLLVVNRSAYILGMIVIVLQVSEKDSEEKVYGSVEISVSSFESHEGQVACEGEQIESKKGYILSRVFT